MTRFLLKEMTEERAKALCDELGFLGLCDCLQYMAERMKGGRLHLNGPRLEVRIKRYRAPKTEAKP